MFVSTVYLIPLVVLALIGLGAIGAFGFMIINIDKGGM